jgi:hypothetical protein
LKKYILNKFALSISSNIKLSLWRIGRILISDSKMIRQKNRIHRKATHFKNPMHWNKFRKIRNEVTCLVRNTKDKSNNDLIQKITNMNSSFHWHGLEATRKER